MAIRILKLNDDHVKDLNFFKKIDNKTLVAFCDLAIEFIMKGGDESQILERGKEFGIDEKLASKGVLALCFLFSECSKSRLSEKEFLLTLDDLKESKKEEGEEKDEEEDMEISNKKILCEFYKNNKKEIRTLFMKDELNSSFGGQLGHYKNLEWRLDVNISKRSVNEIIDPKFIMKLDIEANRKVTSHYISMSYQDLLNLNQQLENSLSQLKNVNARRVAKHLKEI